MTTDYESHQTVPNDENCNCEMVEADDNHVNFKKVVPDNVSSESKNIISYDENSIFNKLEDDDVCFEKQKTDHVKDHSDSGKLRTDSEYGDQRNSVTKETANPPDGGWGWMVVFGCFIHLVIEAGLLTSYGVLYVEIMEYLKVDKVAVSWIGSIRSGLYLGIAPFVLPFTRIFSCREITILGGIIVFGSLIAAAYVLTLPSLIVCLGILQGIGFGFAYATSIIIVNQYFDKKRPIALGFAVCGAAAGQVVYPVLQEVLLKEYGLSGTLILNAALSLNLIVCGAVYFPLQRKKTSRKGISIKKTITSKSESTPVVSILRNPLFVSFFINNVLITSGGFVPLYFIPDLAVRSGFDLNEAAVLVSILGVTSGFGRVMIGSCAFRILKFRSQFYIILTIVSGVLLAMLPLCRHDYGQLAVFIAGYGFTIGGVICLCNVLLVDLFKREFLASSLGYVTLAQGIGGFIGSPIAAGISEAVGSDDVMFYFSGIVFILASILLTISLLCNARTKPISAITKDPEKTPLL